MFYYSWPRTAVVGQYQGTKVVGTAWVDHEYSLGVLGSQKSLDATIPGWNWFSLITSGPSSLEICITQVFPAPCSQRSPLIQSSRSFKSRVSLMSTSYKGWEAAHNRRFQSCSDQKLGLCADFPEVWHFLEAYRPQSRHRH